MDKIMVIGAIDSGKTSLVLAIHGECGSASKTQSINYNKFTIDTPGEYMENPLMYSALMSTALQAKYILFTQDSTSDKSIYPPGFAKAFNVMTIGVITKIDHSDSNIGRAEKHLSNLGLKGPIFKLSSYTGEGIEEIKNFIDV